MASNGIKKIAVALGVVAVIILAILLLWYFFFARAPATKTQTQPQAGDFGTTVGGTNTTGVTVNLDQSSVPPDFASAPGKLQKIFKIADGPIAGATFIQTQNPTTTLARYAMADNGHVFDLGIDMPGAVARAVSNTTIPGLVAAQWGVHGSAALLQYLDGQVTKTVYMGLPTTTPTANSRQAIHIQFLPDNINNFSVSPDGKNIVYWPSGLRKRNSG